MIIVTSSFPKSYVFEMFSVHHKTRIPAGKFKFLRFEDEIKLLWTVSLIVEITLRFQIPPV